MTDTSTRHAGLRHTLGERRRALQEDVRRLVRRGRTDRQVEVGDDLEQSDADLRETSSALCSR